MQTNDLGRIVPIEYMNNKIRVCLTLFIAFLLCLYLFLSGFRQSQMTFSLNDIEIIRGKLIYDSSLSSKGNRILRIRLDSCFNCYGNVSSASGVATVVTEKCFALSCGTEILCKGKFSNTLFIASDVIVTGKTRLQKFRERMIIFLEDRLKGRELSEGGLLTVALLLGRTEDRALPLKDRARSCGCLHVLALSGMHLQSVLFFCKLVFGKKRFGKIMGLCFVSAFVFSAGPRPSLVRAYIMFILNFREDTNDRKESLICTFALHCFLFPLQVTDLGFVYGYSATFALVFLSPLIKRIMRVFLPVKTAEILASSVSTLVFTGPLQLLSEGCWHPAALILSPFAGILAKISMSLGIVKLIVGQTGFCVLQRTSYTNVLTGCSVFVKIGRIRVLPVMLQWFLYRLLFYCF